MGSCNAQNTNDNYPQNFELNQNNIGQQDCFKKFLKYIANAVKISYIIGCNPNNTPLQISPLNAGNVKMTINYIKINYTLLFKEYKPDPYNYLGYVGEIKSGLKMVVFRGTLGDKTGIEWEQDYDSLFFVPINNLRTDDPSQNLFATNFEAKVGRGFLNFFGKSYYQVSKNPPKYIYNQLTEYLDVQSGDIVIFCGHSLGCAVAYLSALWFSNKYPNNKFMVVNFAPPKVCGNKEFCKMFKTPNCLGVFNIINKQDPVPRLHVGLGATQCCNVIYYDKKNQSDNHSIINYYNNGVSNLWGTESYPDCQPPPNAKINLNSCPSSQENFSLFGSTITSCQSVDSKIEPGVLKTKSLSDIIANPSDLKPTLKYIANAVKIAYIRSAQNGICQKQSETQPLQLPPPNDVKPIGLGNFENILINYTCLPGDTTSIYDPYNYLGYVGKIKSGLKMVVFRGTLGDKDPLHPSVEWQQDDKSLKFVPINSLNKNLFSKNTDAKVGAGFLSFFCNIIL